MSRPLLFVSPDDASGVRRCSSAPEGALAAIHLIAQPEGRACFRKANAFQYFLGLPALESKRIPAFLQVDGYFWRPKRIQYFLRSDACSIRLRRLMSNACD